MENRFVESPSLNSGDYLLRSAEKRKDSIGRYSAVNELRKKTKLNFMLSEVIRLCVGSHFLPLELSKKTCRVITFIYFAYRLYFSTSLNSLRDHHMIIYKIDKY